jgi:hypothetical protein
MRQIAAVSCQLDVADQLTRRANACAGVGYEVINIAACS